MAVYELLSPKIHSNLRLDSLKEKTPHFTQIVTSEFAAAAACCPIMFTKEPDTGNFFAGVVLSLKPDEPELKSLEERGGFNPLSLLCRGFYISEEHIVIDRDNSRFNGNDGELLFTESLQPADCLRQIQNALGKFHFGVEATTRFINELVELQLIEPIEMSLSFDNGERLTLQGLFTVSLDALRDIDDVTALKMFRSGHLELAYLVAASLKQFPVLAHLRNQRLMLSH